MQVLVLLLLVLCHTGSCSATVVTEQGGNGCRDATQLVQKQQQTQQQHRRLQTTRGTTLDIIPLRYNDDNDENTTAPTAAAATLEEEENGGLFQNAELNEVWVDTSSNSTPASSEWYSSFPSAVGTNFLNGTAYNFTHIFLVGGHCNIDDDWYSKFVAAGMETLGVPVENNICSNVKDEAYTREFHIEALWQVEALVGDKINETLVITAAIGLESDWTPVADLLRKGMAFFHAKEDPQNFNLTEYGLPLDKVLYYYFRWDEAGSAERAGKELCRVKGGTQSLKIAKIYTAGRDGSLNYRVDVAIEAFQNEDACSSVELVDLWTMESDASDQAFKTTLLFNPLPDIIFTAQDMVAKRIIDVARNSLSTDRYSRIATTGWDNIHTDLLEQYKILTTVDQLVHYPGEGLWGVFKTVISILEETGLNSTKAIQNELDLADSLTISSDTLTISSDRVGYLISTLLQGYDAGYPPFQEVLVSSGLYDVTITRMIPFEGKFEAVIWLQTSWFDPRLEWNPSVFSGEIPMEPDTIWTPRLYFQNEFDNEDLYTAPAIVTYDGRVVMRQNMMAEFLCSTTEDLRSFPFDIYSCAIVLGAPAGITLDHIYGFSVVETDPHFSTTTATDDTPEVGETLPPGSRSEFIYYRLIFERRPFIAYVRLILPAVLINMVGFMAFWIPEMQESVALGITSLLCSLTFRETVEMPDTADVTWTEVFMMINVSYQASVMFIIWCSYGHSNQVAYNLDKWFHYIHPLRLVYCIMGVPIVVGKWVVEKSIIIPSRVKQPEDYDKPRRGKRDDGVLRRDFSRNNGNLTEESWHQNAMQTNENTRNLVANEIYNRHNASLSTFAGGEEETAMRSSKRLESSSHHARRMARSMGDSTDDDDDDDDDEWLESATNKRFETPQNDSTMYRGGGTPPAALHTSVYDVYTAKANQDRFQNFLKKKQKQAAQVQPDYKHGKGYVQQKFGSENRPVDEQDNRINVDWIGRWFLAPSYVIVTATLLATGWGFYNTPGAAAAAELGINNYRHG